MWIMLKDYHIIHTCTYMPAQKFLKKYEMEQEYQHWKCSKSDTGESNDENIQMGSPISILNFFEIFPFNKPVVFNILLHEVDFAPGGAVFFKGKFPFQNFVSVQLFFQEPVSLRNMGFLHWYIFIFPEPGFSFPYNKAMNSSCLLHIPLVFYKKTSTNFTVLFLSGPP